MKKKLFLVGLASLFLLTGCGTKVELQDGKQVVASVDGKKITAEELFDELKQQYGVNNVINALDSYIVNKEITDDTAAKNYANTQLSYLKNQADYAGVSLETALSQYGFLDQKDFLDYYQMAYKKKEAVKKYLKEHKVTEDEINKYYEENIYGDYNAKHILIKSTATSTSTEEEKTAAEEAAKAKAQEVIDKLNSGAKWEDLVKEYSEDTGSKDNDGLIENFTKGDVVDEFFNAVVGLKDKEYTKEPVKSSFGYHVILRVSATEKPSLKDSKDKILEALVTNYLEQDENLFNDTMVEIRKSYNLSISDNTLKKQYEEKISTK